MNSTSSTLSTPPPSSSKVSPKTAVKDCVAGACAGAIAKTAVAPIERVKLLMQLQFSIDRSPRSMKERVPTRTSAWEVMKRVYREEGILSFWRGECVFDETGRFYSLTLNHTLINNDRHRMKCAS